MRRISDGCSHSNGFTPTAKPSTGQNPEASIRVAQMRSADDGAAAPTIAGADRGSPHSCPEKCRNGPYQKSEHLRVRAGLMPNKSASSANAKPSGLCFLPHSPLRLLALALAYQISGKKCGGRAPPAARLCMLRTFSLTVGRRPFVDSGIGDASVHGRRPCHRCP
jgi:hypothetical protein